MIVLIAISVVGVLHAIRLEHRLQTLNTSIQTAQTAAENGQLAQARSQLNTAEVNLTSINSSLYNSPDFGVLDVLPVARQNIQAVRSAVRLGLQLVGGGQQIFNAAAPLEGPNGHLDVSLQAGQVPAGAIQAIQAALTPVVTNLPTTATPPGGRFVLGRVRSAEQRVWNEAVQRRAELTSVNDGLTILNELSGGNGDRRYLIAVANSAEMRGAGGMILSYGVLDSSGGKISLGNFGPIADLALSHPAPATFPADFTRTFGNLQPNRFWQEATIMSDFTVDAPVLESMYTQATGLPVNGVIQVDPAGLGAVLAGTGPIQDPQLGTVDTANVVPLTLNQAYVAFPNRPVRQEYLTGVAKEAFAALTSGNLPSLRPLGTALVQAAQQRHIILSSTDPTTQATITALGFDGAMPPPNSDFTQLTVQNFGANKLDYYLQSHLTLTGTRSGGSAIGRVQATIDLTNTAPPDGKSQYIFGPGPNTADPPGEYRGLVTLYLPQYSSLVRAQTDATATAPQSGSQNKLSAITFQVTIPAGAPSHVVLTMNLPPRPRDLAPFAVVPTPRVLPTTTDIRVS